jgi:hypothetical protein
MLEIEEHIDMEVESVALCTETSHIQNVVAPASQSQDVIARQEETRNIIARQEDVISCTCV